ncbi:MAG: hypothetical protein GYA14_14610 [Ignavibacteria bacterium]|nr:hypothetical protein [Ignavibacteria bacterium]
MEELLKVLDKISAIYGPIYGTLFFVLLVGLFLILYFFQKRIKNISEEISSRAISEFNKKLDLIFRDETIRTSLRYKIAQDSVDKKMEFYKKVNETYFIYQKSWLFTKETPDEDIKSISDAILKLREELFINSIYLGGELSDKLIRSVSFMYSDFRRKVEEIKNPYRISKQDTIDYVMQLSDLMADARKWLVENIFPDQTVKQFEFTPEQQNRIEEEKKKFLDNKNIGVS